MSSRSAFLRRFGIATSAFLCSIALGACALEDFVSKDYQIDISGFLVSSDPDQRFAESQGMSIPTVPSLGLNDSLVVVSDTHFNGTNHATNGLSASLSLPTPPKFILCAGDLAQNGNPTLYIKATKYFTDTGLPFISVPGNHDMYYSTSGGGWEAFKAGMGPSCFSFSSGSLRVIGMDSASGTLGARQLRWLEGELSRKTEPHCLIVTHMNFFGSDQGVESYFGFSNYKERDYLESLFSKYGVDMVISGHTHGFQRNAKGGVEYLVCPSFDSESRVRYIRVTVASGGLSYEKVGF